MRSEYALSIEKSGIENLYTQSFNYLNTALFSDYIPFAATAPPYGNFAEPKL